MIRVTVETIAGERRDQIAKNYFTTSDFLTISLGDGTVVMYSIKYIRAITIHKIGSEYIG